MGEPTTIATLTTTAKAIAPLINEAHKILKERGVYERFRDWCLRRTPKKVLVLGVSGTGKTSLLRYLNGLNPYVAREDRTDGSKPPIEGKILQKAFRFIDTPGELHRKPTLNKAIIEAASSPPLGIINVVSYGYHETSAIPINSVLKNSQASEEFLQKNIHNEIEHLSAWVSLLCGREGAAVWLMTVVTKADLWWTSDSYNTVLDHYRSGRYFQALNEAREIKGSVRPFSALNQLFYGEVAMSGYYSDVQRRSDRINLIAALLEYVSE